MAAGDGRPRITHGAARIAPVTPVRTIAAALERFPRPRVVLGNGDRRRRRLADLQRGQVPGLVAHQQPGAVLPPVGKDHGHGSRPLAEQVAAREHQAAALPGPDERARAVAGDSPGQGVGDPGDRRVRLQVPGRATTARFYGQNRQPTRFAHALAHRPRRDSERKEDHESTKTRKKLHSGFPPRPCQRRDRRTPIPGLPVSCFRAFVIPNYAARPGSATARA